MNIKIYTYYRKTGLFNSIKSGDVNSVLSSISNNENFTLTPPPDYGQVWRWIDTEWVELLPINNPDIPYDDKSIWDGEQNQWVVCPELAAYKYVENQELMWERIKQLRQEKITQGVYIPSIDKHFHTDETSVALYTNIGNSIALGVFKPLNWKTMEGDFVKLTETLFKEVHVAIINNTESIYAKAEWHKYMMMQADEPLEYDYKDKW